MGEDDGLAGGVAPVFIEDLGFVFGCYEGHFGWYVQELYVCVGSLISWGSRLGLEPKLSL